MSHFHLLVIFFTGISATAITDLWNLLLNRGFNIRSLNFCFLGRWLLYMPQGTFSHKSINVSPPKSFECQVGWITHYCIGVALTFVFVFLAPGDWMIKPTLIPALLYGICIVIFPLFILQPAIGFGMASSNTPNPVQARIKSIMTHFIFGIGLWLSAMLINIMTINS